MNFKLTFLTWETMTDALVLDKVSFLTARLHRAVKGKGLGFLFILQLLRQQSSLFAAEMCPRLPLELKAKLLRLGTALSSYSRGFFLP